MHAHVGDEVLVMSPREGRHIARDGEVLEVLTIAGDEAYRVRWADNGHEVLFIPGPDAMVRHLHDCADT